MIAPRERKTICGFLFGSVVIDECVVTSKSVLVVVMRKRLENSDFVFCFFSSKCLCSLCLFLNNNGDKTLGVLDVDSLDVAVELLLGALLVVSPSADADAESVRDTLDTLLPDLLVQLGVDADIRRLLLRMLVTSSWKAHGDWKSDSRIRCRYMTSWFEIVIWEG